MVLFSAALTAWALGACVSGTHDTSAPTVYRMTSGGLILDGMPNYRRFTVAGATVFFTVVTYRRRPFLVEPLARRCLREAYDVVRQRHPIEVPAIVLLPNHLHAIWSLPRGDSDYSMRWRRIKEEFTERYMAEGGGEGVRSASRLRRKERGIWQRQFREHTIEDDGDFERHVDYIHYNPVKHGLAACPSEWPYSSFQRWVKREAYPPDWGCADHGPIRFDDLDETAME